MKSNTWEGGGYMTDDKKKSETIMTKDGWLVGGRKYPKEQPPIQAAKKIAKVIQELLKKDLH